MTPNQKTLLDNNWASILRRLIRVLCLLTLWQPYKTVQANDTSGLHVVITGLRSNLGNVHIAIYDDPEKFPAPDGMIREIEVPISARVARYYFSGLDRRDYAIAVYHDENNNNSFDQGFLNIPLEDYAFSNKANVFLGPPSFSAAAFNLSKKKEIVIQIED